MRLAHSLIYIALVLFCSHPRMSVAISVEDLDLPLSASGFYPSTVLNVAEFGAVGDNATVNTAALQKAIDTAASSAGGGIVLFPGPAVYYSGALRLASNVYLYFTRGAYLQGSWSPNDYPEDWDFWDIIHTEGASNCGVIGDGLSGGVVGPMWQMVERYDPDQDQLVPVTWQGVRGCRGECRPRGIVFVDCVNVTMSRFVLRDSADWSSLFRRCSNVAIHDMNILGSNKWANNDGIDLESGFNITIARCNIEVGDDGVVFVSGNTNNMNHPWPEPIGHYSPLSHVLVTDVRVSSHSSALKFEAIFQVDHGDVFDIVIRNVVIENSNRGIGFQQRTGIGAWYNVWVENVTIHTEFIKGSNWWGAGEPIWITSVPEGENLQQPLAGGIYNVTFQRVLAVSDNGVLVSSRSFGSKAGGPVQDITFRDLTLTISNLNPASPPRPILDFRPQDVNQAWDVVQVSAVTVEHAANIVFDTCQVGFDAQIHAPLPAYWSGQCFNNTADSRVSEINTSCIPPATA